MTAGCASNVAAHSVISMVCPSEVVTSPFWHSTTGTPAGTKARTCSSASRVAETSTTMKTMLADFRMVASVLAAKGAFTGRSGAAGSVPVPIALPYPQNGPEARHAAAPSAAHLRWLCPNFLTMMTQCSASFCMSVMTELRVQEGAAHRDRVAIWGGAKSSPSGSSQRSVAAQAIIAALSVHSQPGGTAMSNPAFSAAALSFVKIALFAATPLAMTSVAGP